MDKLQPLIKHRYWICFGLAVIFVVTGWWMASGAIAAATDTRKKSVEDSFSKAKNGASDPNEQWVEAAKKKNEKDNASKQSASRLLWQRQKEARKWPASLEPELGKIPYFGMIENNTARARWARNYQQQFEELLEIVKPFKPATGEGLVLVTPATITHKPFRTWKSGPPASAEIWNNQEDLWLLRALLTSIARVNEGATRLSESQVRKILRLHLRGGDRNAAPAAAGGAAGTGAGAMGDMSMMMMSAGRGEEDGGLGMAGMPAMGGLNAGTVPNPAKEYEGSPGSDILSEEFGPDSSATSGLGGAGAMPGADMAAMMGANMGEMAGATATAAPAEEVRYVDDKAGLYKTRAFLLDVVVRDDQVPNLLASLTNSDFPVEIVRVDITSAAAGTSPGGIPGMTDGSMETGAPNAMMAPGGMGMAIKSGRSGGAMEMPGADALSGTLGTEDVSGAFGAAGMPGLSGMPGMPGDVSASGLGGMSTAATRGAEILQAAMKDPLLVTVKIGGLMTLYQSLEEAESQDATEKEAASEAATTSTGTESAEPGANSEAAATADAVPAADGTAPAEGSTPAEGTAAADPAATPDAAVPATEGSQPPAAGTDASAAPPSSDPAGTSPEPAATPAEPSAAPAEPGSATNTENGNPSEPANSGSEPPAEPGAPGQGS